LDLLLPPPSIFLRLAETSAAAVLSSAHDPYEPAYIQPELIHNNYNYNYPTGPD